MPTTHRAADDHVLPGPDPSASAIDVDHVGVMRGGVPVLGDVSLRIAPGELVAVIGASGAGKSTLLDVMAGIRSPTSGAVRTGEARDAARVSGPSIGYVPQDDVIHRGLPVGETLRHAARLRLPAGTSAEEVERVVAWTLARLELAHRAGTTVGHLSGGQRKRTSIAVELLTRPQALFLDEPTSGLDPATAASLMALLRALAHDGTTVVLTTHSPEDVRRCDRLVLVADGGVAFTGTPDEARRHFDVEHLGDLYLATARAADPVHPTPESAAPPATPRIEATPAPRARGKAPGAAGQWRILAVRNAALLRRSRLTLAIMLAAPALVIAMFAMLFRAGALSPAHPDAAAAVSTTYWMAFAAFFFGLTYGLLQVVVELPIVRRERFVGLHLGAYVAAKVTVLTPVLAAADVAMLAVLRGLDRIPPLDAGTAARLTTTLLLTSVAALGLGLLASAAVADAAQATLALSMLCFPAVLFAGAVLPVQMMEAGGRLVSVVVAVRWSFEALGHDLGLGGLLAQDPSGAGRALLAQQGHAFDGSTAGHWAILATFAAAFLLGTVAVLRRRTSS